MDDQRGISLVGRRLTTPEFSSLCDVPAVTEWFANLDNPRTRTAYRVDLP